MASIVPKPRKDGSISFQVYVRLKGADPVTKTLDTREQAEEFAMFDAWVLRFPTMSL